DPPNTVSPSMLASIPARTLNPIRSRRGIPRFSLFGKCSNGTVSGKAASGRAVHHPAARHPRTARKNRSLISDFDGSPGALKSIGDRSTYVKSWDGK
ncbi:MAG: hypothetical protein ABSG18_26915, partial [Steroidobacteraceae bacterium]